MERVVPPRIGQDMQVHLQREGSMRRIRSWLAAAVLPTLLTTGLAFAQDQQAKSFLTEAIEGNLAEVQMGQLAQKLASTTGVRAFGQMLEQDHTVANQKARTAASAIQITVPTQPNSKQKTDYDRLSELSVAEFDAQSADHMVMDHKEDMQKLDKPAAILSPAGAYLMVEMQAPRKH